MLSFCTCPQVKLLEFLFTTYAIQYVGFYLKILTWINLIFIKIINPKGDLKPVILSETVISIVKVVLNYCRRESGVLIVEPDSDLLRRE